MIVSPQEIERDGKTNVPSLYIWKIFSNPMKSGFGTKMLNFAKYYSEKKGLKGYFHLEASPIYATICSAYFLWKVWNEYKISSIK